ncbi:hypothetical protein L1987_09374 [Smallanthus sonchifolius]|uniref:Uncharacterized protein n=1 Tax=Smallanthus sonchifolius TaxID=185202 RepID=A0ACB9JPG6_9ASTR|nr:hypothetical protein L1987_09374 [Smallanthus sonchifolius]
MAEGITGGAIVLTNQESIALSLILQTVRGRPRTKTRRVGKSKRKQPPPPPPCGSSYTDVEDEQEREKATGYQTWVAGDGSRDDKTNGSFSSFGGWEELEGRITRS